jgi:alpha-tubulin suppressor-like RCC1 family protein
MAAIAVAGVFCPIVGACAAPSVSAGGSHSVAVKADGSVASWGDDSAGQLGQGRTLSSSLPVKVAGLANVQSVAAGESHVLVLLGNGTVWSWGGNDTGQLGDGTTTARATPMQVGGLPPIAAVSAGNLHSLALAQDGSVWAWGWNGFGQLGDNTTSMRTTPVRVPGLTNIRWIATGDNHSLALDGDGVVWAWGFNPYGQLGDGTTTNRTSPVRVVGLGPVARISAGAYHSAAVAFDRTLWMWGLNSDGQLGDGTRIDRSIPARVDLQDVIGVCAGGSGTIHKGFTIAILADHTLAAWGNNDYGQLGDGTTTSRSVPAPVSGLRDVVDYDAGTTHVAAVTQDGLVWAWGSNDAGELGNGTRAGSTSPRQAVGAPAMTSVSAGQGFTVGLARDGTVVAWGGNGSGELAMDFTQSHAVPIHVDISDVASVSAGGGHTLALKKSGEVWAWGANPLGELGDGSTTSRATPGVVSGLPVIIQVAAGTSHSLALATDGSVWAWGDNRSGQVGNGDVTRSEPRASKVSGLPASRAISAGNCHSVALANDGTVWEWGTEAATLCVGAPRTRPVRIAGLANIVAIAAGSYHTLAVRSDGTVWAWGYNVNGQLGIGNTFSSSTPVPVATPSAIRSVAAGSYHSLALAVDGTVWGWGFNDSGQVGDGTTNLAVSPVRVLDLTDIVAIAGGTSNVSGHSLALKADGSVWAWGNNIYGELGDGTLALRTRPVVVVREGGAGTVSGGDWFLDLTPSIAKSIPFTKVPPFLAVTSGSISDHITLVADVKFSPGDIGKPIYLFAYVPPSQPGLQKDGNDACVPATIFPSGTLGPHGVNNLQPSGGTVTTAAGQILPVANNVPVQGKEGISYCTGVGITPQEAIAHGRCLGTVPGASPCVPAETSAAATSYQGLWWRKDGTESGWGLNISHQGEILFATWFTYDVDGSDMWLVMSEGAKTSDGTYGGKLYRATGPPFSASPWNGSQVTRTEVGNATLSFTDADNGTFSYTVNGVTQSKPIGKFLFSSSPTTCTLGGDAGGAVNYQDLWWASPAGVESGWGLNVAHQGDILFATWFTYETGNKGLWLVMSNGTKTGNATYAGDLQRTMGPPFNTPQWVASQVTRTTVGNAMLTFSDANNATFRYTVNGITQTKAITRLVYALPVSVCH